MWELVAHDEDAEQVRLEFVLRNDDRTMAIWPHEFELFLRFELGRTCTITLEARGDYQSTGALHSYFYVGDVAGVSVAGIGKAYLDHVSGEQGRQVGGVQDFPGRIDRAFSEPGAVSRIEDPALDRVIEVRHVNHSDVVVWNPGPELSKSMADLTDEGYREFVCVETARINQPMISSAGEPARLSTVISVTAAGAISSK
jgi:glucose-6-phosphate 1-epimerase